MFRVFGNKMETPTTLTQLIQNQFETVSKIPIESLPFDSHLLLKNNVKDFL